MLRIADAWENRIRPFVAWKAVIRLIKDPSRTFEVFRIIDALKGSSASCAVERLMTNDESKALLINKPSIVKALRSCRIDSTDSLGSIYRKFVSAESISAEELINESKVSPYTGYRSLDERWMGERLRDIHDLFHVITGYGRDALGELCLLAFTNAQHYNRGIALIVFMGRRQYLRDHPKLPIDACLDEARNLAINSCWLPGISWEAKLKLPIKQVREDCRLFHPAMYERTLLEVEKGIYG